MEDENNIMGQAAQIEYDDEIQNDGSLLDDNDENGVITDVKKSQKDAKKNKLATGCYPTRYQLIGLTNCFFLSWYKKGKVPLITIGPSKLPCLFLITFALSIFCYLGYLVALFRKESINAAIICTCGMFINLGLFFSTMLSEPGVPQSVYERYYKLKYVK